MFFLFKLMFCGLALLLADVEALWRLALLWQLIQAVA
jgi:hypothetical protein